MISKGVKNSTKEKVDAYLSYLYSIERYRDRESEKDLIKKLPETLKSELFNEAFGAVLRKNKWLRDKFSSKFIDRLALCVQEKTIGAGDYLFHDVVNLDERQSLYILVKGEFEIVIDLPAYNDKQGIVLKTVKDEGFINDVSFVTGENDMSLNVRAATFTQYYQLSRADFLDTIKYF